MLKTAYGEYDEEYGDQAPDFTSDFEWEPPADYDSNKMFYTDDEEEEWDWKD